MIKTRFAALVIGLIAAHGAHAKPSQVDIFAGERYVARGTHAQAAGDVARAIGHKADRKRLHRAKAHRWPPLPRHRPILDPGTVDPLTVWGGIKREAAQIVSGRPRAWCGWWLGRHLGMPLRKLWIARNWVSVGSNAGQPGIGVVVVWRHHVGIITGRDGSGWIIKSGNDGRRVRERPRSVAGAIAFRRVS